ncbi:MAG: ABC transporter permease, partial [candidate division Zixibacteria bacterium]|nr:ABC transporter permease [candidate division Zixibacteria bacterium]
MTMLGVLIGVSSVIGMASIIAALDNQVNKEIEGFGANSIFVTKFPIDTDYGELSEEERNRKPIDFEAAQAIMEYCPSVTGVAPQNYYTAQGGNIVKYKNNQANRPSFFGTLPDYPKVTTQNVEYGRFFNDLDMQRRAMVCVIGSDIATALFKFEEPLLKQIRINSRQFTVIGVMEEKEAGVLDGGGNDNNKISIPYSTYEKLIPWEKELWLQVSAESSEKMQQAIDEITTVMRRLRGVPYNKPNNFAVWTQERMKEMAADLAGLIYLISLGVSGMG